MKGGAGRVNLNVCNDEQETPLHAAARGGHHGCVGFLLAAGAAIDAADEVKALYLSSRAFKESELQDHFQH